MVPKANCLKLFSLILHQKLISDCVDKFLEWFFSIEILVNDNLLLYNCVYLLMVLVASQMVPESN